MAVFASNLIDVQTAPITAAGQTAPITAAGESRLAVAGLFPGQGSHTPDMREQVCRHDPQLLRRCIELVGEDPFLRVTESTRFAQPAIYCASIASLIAHQASSPHACIPIAYAGHSLGELAALVAAGAIGREDGLMLAVRRGELMAQAGEGAGAGGMLALLGVTDEQRDALAERYGVVIANENAPGQTVLAGPVDSVRAAAASARDQGLRAMTLDVAAAFHSPAMADAVQPFKDVLAGVEAKRCIVPVISCATAEPFDDVKAELAEAIAKPVRWRATMATLSRLGARAFLDFGPGKVLARLVPHNVEGASTIEPGRGVEGTSTIEPGRDVESASTIEPEWAADRESASNAA